MSVPINNDMRPLRSERKNRDGPPKIDLHSEYYKMTMDLPGNPQSIRDFIWLFSEILRPLAESKGELVILDDGAEICFAYEGKPFSNFGAIPLAVIEEHFVDQVRHFVELLILGQGVESKTIRVEARNIGSSQWIEDLGVWYMYEKWGLERLNALVRTMAQYAPVKDEYRYSGWDLDGGGFYIMNGQQLRGTDWNEERANISCRHAMDMLNIAPYSLTITLLSIALLSLVHSRMVDQGSYFRGVCCIVAPTQSFKTTLASLFFDYHRGMEADVNFEATMVAMVRTIGNNRDATVIADDYKPGATKAESKEMLKKISMIIRMCSDNSGGIKKAGTQNSTIENIARGLVVVTAEQIQLNVQSSLARLLVLEMNRKSVDVQKLTYFQETHILFREFVEAYIMYISKQGVDKYCKNLAQRFSQERDVLRKEVDDSDILVDNRTNDMCTWLYISFTEFLKYAFCVNAISQEQFDEYIRESVSIFRSIMEKQAERVAELDDTKRFFSGLQVLIETKEAHIEELKTRNIDFTVRNSKTAVGFSKKNYIFLKNEVAFQQVVSYYRQNGKEFSMSESALRKLLADNNYIEPKDAKSYIHRLYVNHKTYQCIRFDATKFYKLIGGSRNEEQNDREISSSRGERKVADNLFGRGDGAV